MSTKFLVLGGEGGSADFISMGAGIFLKGNRRKEKS